MDHLAEIVDHALATTVLLSEDVPRGRIAECKVHWSVRVQGTGACAAGRLWLRRTQSTRTGPRPSNNVPDMS